MKANGRAYAIKPVAWDRTMPSFRYQCPLTDETVESFLAEDTDRVDDHILVRCAACKQPHIVNPDTGKILGEQQ